MSNPSPSDGVRYLTARGFNWWFLGNLILGGLIGVIVDPITGGIYEVKPEDVYVDFESAPKKAEITQTVNEKDKKEKAA